MSSRREQVGLPPDFISMSHGPSAPAAPLCPQTSTRGGPVKVAQCPVHRALTFS